MYAHNKRFTAYVGTSGESPETQSTQTCTDKLIRANRAGGVLKNTSSEEFCLNISIGPIGPIGRIRPI